MNVSALANIVPPRIPTTAPPNRSIHPINENLTMLLINFPMKMTIIITKMTNDTIGVFSNQASCERIGYSVVYRLNKYWEDNPIKEFTQKN